MEYTAKDCYLPVVTYMEVRCNPGLVSKGSEEFEMRIAVDRSDSFGWRGKAWGQFKLGKPEEAYVLLPQIVHFFPDDWEIRYHMALYAAQLGLLEESRKWLVEAFQINPDVSLKEKAMADEWLTPLRQHRL